MRIGEEVVVQTDEDCAGRVREGGELPIVRIGDLTEAIGRRPLSEATFLSKQPLDRLPREGWNPLENRACLLPRRVVPGHPKPSLADGADDAGRVASRVKPGGDEDIRVEDDGGTVSLHASS